MLNTKTVEQDMLGLIRLAHREWKDKERLLDEVTDPDLIDYAIYEAKASRIKYMYLLKQYKRQIDNTNICINSDEKLASS